MPEPAPAPANFEVNHPPVLIITIGHADRGDDGIGPTAARLLQTRLAGRARIEEQSGEPAALIESWQGSGLVIVIDAVCAGASPGTIHRLEVGRQGPPLDSKPCSSHGLGLAEAIELARALGQLPPRLIVLGIEPKSFEPGRPLSKEVNRSLPRLLAQIDQELPYKKE